MVSYRDIRVLTREASHQKTEYRVTVWVRADGEKFSLQEVAIEGVEPTRSVGGVVYGSAEEAFEAGHCQARLMIGETPFPMGEYWVVGKAVCANGPNDEPWKGRWAVFRHRPSEGSKPVEEGDTENFYLTGDDALLFARTEGGLRAEQLQGRSYATPYMG